VLQSAPAAEDMEPSEEERESGSRLPLTDIQSWRLRLGWPLRLPGERTAPLGWQSTQGCIFPITSGGRGAGGRAM